ncbi:MAG: Hint domain-containing protein, partial [Rhodospirillales bacterium]|nr:Hint domain-containing protein [Rhodospirillales bacterium]
TGAVVTAVATDAVTGGTYRLSDVATLQFADQTIQAAGIADGGPLGPLNAAQTQLAGFMSGIDADGRLTASNGWTWNGNDPATYGTEGSAHKWAGGPAGTPATISYWLDPGSAWTETETASFLASMSLWSSLANVRFTAAPDEEAATFAFYRYNTPTPPEPLSAGAYARAYYDAGAAGADTVPATQGAYISINTTVPQWSQLGSFTTYGGEGPGTVVHELGHVLGLFHAGPYNTTADVATQQLNQYDTQLWSTMSYISPMTPGAKYADQYPVTGTDWGSAADGRTREPTTPMMLDIPAIQQLYGLPEGGAFTGGQVFGFNCNITAACRPYFDFTVNPTPVITIWDPGPGNTLDLSGYGTRCVVDLNPGTFSSFAGMTNNLGIAFGSRIDRAIGGAGDDRFIVNAASDTIDGGAGTNDVVFAGRVAQYALSRSGGVVTVAAIDAGLGGTYTLTNVASLVFQDATVETGTIPCFVTGTRIATPDGWTPVERLRIGDRVLLHDGSVLPVRWLGRRRVDCRRHADPARVQPIRVRAGSFGPNQPRRDLFLSPDHALLVDGVLVPVRYLVDGTDIAQVPRRSVTYWHVELPRHEVLIAEGVPAESYLDTGDRDRFATPHAAPPVCPGWSAELRCRPLAVRRPATWAAPTKSEAPPRRRRAPVARIPTSHEMERT